MWRSNGSPTRLNKSTAIARHCFIRAQIRSVAFGTMASPQLAQRQTPSLRASYAPNLSTGGNPSNAKDSYTPRATSTQEAPSSTTATTRAGRAPSPVVVERLVRLASVTAKSSAEQIANVTTHLDFEQTASSNEIEVLRQSPPTRARQQREDTNSVDDGWKTRCRVFAGPMPIESSQGAQGKELYCVDRNAELAAGWSDTQDGP